MSNEFCVSDGRLLVQYARNIATCHICGLKLAEFENKGKKIFNQPHSVFVTVHTYPKHELRGCIGFIQNPPKLLDAVALASIHACTNDPRFEPIPKHELENILFEVSVLSTPSILKCPARERHKNIKIGKDGLVIEYGNRSGLLLAQVATEWNFTPIQFFEALCEKAGLPKDMYSSESAKVYSFTQQVFEEKTPNGKIIQKKLLV